MSLLVKGISKLSQLDIDVDKDWSTHLIRNIGAAVDGNDAIRKAQAILQAVMTGKGDLIYRGDSEATKLPLSYGVGYNFLHALDVNIGTPEWRDIQNIIVYLTGAVNRMIAPPVLVIPSPAIGLVVDEDHSGGAFVAEKGVTIPAPSVAISELAVFDQRYESGDDGDFSLYGDNWEAQTFTVNVAHSIEIVEIKCRRVGNPGNITIAVRATDGLGLPTGADLTNVTFDGNALGTTDAWITTYIASYSLLAGTKYAIVIRAPSGNASNYLVWRKDGTAPAYVAGARAYSVDGGSGWAEDTNTDFMFREGEVK